MTLVQTSFVDESNVTNMENSIRLCPGKCSVLTSQSRGEQVRGEREVSGQPGGGGGGREGRPAQPRRVVRRRQGAPRRRGLSRSVG